MLAFLDIEKYNNDMKTAMNFYKLDRIRRCFAHDNEDHDHVFCLTNFKKSLENMFKIALFSNYIMPFVMYYLLS